LKIGDKKQVSAKLTELCFSERFTTGTALLTAVDRNDNDKDKKELTCHMQSLKKNRIEIKNSKFLPDKDKLSYMDLFLGQNQKQIVRNSDESRYCDKMSDEAEYIRPVKSCVTRCFSG
jgi:hypothetical protein